jgi:ABC-type nitrate/sulfonate/bicarbonate transport system substrate-binding protein
VKSILAAIMLCCVFSSSVEGADRIRIAVTNYNITYLTAGVALKKGFFKDEGFDPEIILTTASVSISALASGYIDYTMVFSAVVRAAMRGVLVKVIATFIDSPTYVILARPGIQSFKEFKGRSIAIGSFGSSADVVAQLISKHFGLDPKQDIKLIALGADSARLAAMSQGIVDGAVVAPPSDSEGKKMGFSVVTKTNEIVRFPYMGLGTNSKKLTEKPDEVRKVIKAAIRANQFMIKNREEAIQILMEWAKTDRAGATASFDSTWKGFSPNGFIPEDGLRVVIDQAKNDLKIGREVPSTEVADLNPVREAMRELGLK